MFKNNKLGDFIMLVIVSIGACSYLYLTEIYPISWYIVVIYCFYWIYYGMKNVRNLKLWK